MTSASFSANIPAHPSHFRRLPAFQDAYAHYGCRFRRRRLIDKRTRRVVVFDAACDAQLRDMFITGDITAYFWTQTISAVSIQLAMSSASKVMLLTLICICYITAMWRCLLLYVYVMCIRSSQKAACPPSLPSRFRINHQIIDRPVHCPIVNPFIYTSCVPGTIMVKQCSLTGKSFIQQLLWCARWF